LEANGFSQDWAASIFQTASEIAQSQKIRERAAEVADQAAVERAWWDEKRERSTRELLGGANSDEDGILVESLPGSTASAKSGAASSRKGKNAR
jgi:translocation protein SEC66